MKEIWKNIRKNEVYTLLYKRSLTPSLPDTFVAGQNVEGSIICLHVCLKTWLLPPPKVICKY